ncbi:SDR family NAD(P)-dependent oxidoreductase [Salinispora arenicola]|nr:NADP-dependent 3-hydroxy acid dehydrogenase YdfG [Salinispora arenicola]
MGSSGKRVAMVSGASRGIGRMIAERLLCDGFRISAGVRDPDVAAQFEGDPAAYMVYPYDARDQNSARTWVSATVERFGRVDVLVVNAGIFLEWEVDSPDDGPLDKMWETNVRGAAQLVQASWNELKESASGRVVTVSSMSGLRVKSARSTGYAMTKFALTALTDGIRQSGWNHGIRATAICPGYVATDMGMMASDAGRQNMTQPETVAQLVSTIISLPNEASVPLVPLTCELEP